MIYIRLIILTFMCIKQGIIIYEFNSDTTLERWRIVNDVVMGGKSTSTLTLDNQQNGVFAGYVSIENNGGFSSIQLDTDKITVGTLKKIKLIVKGDGGIFQFRIKNNNNEYYSYVYNFNTNGNWETISIPLTEMKPSFRGNSLELPNFNHNTIESIGILKSSKINSEFKILIKSINLTK